MVAWFIVLEFCLIQNLRSNIRGWVEEIITWYQNKNYMFMIFTAELQMKLSNYEYK